MWKKEGKGRAFQIHLHNWKRINSTLVYRVVVLLTTFFFKLATEYRIGFQIILSVAPKKNTLYISTTLHTAILCWKQSTLISRNCSRGNEVVFNFNQEGEGEGGGEGKGGRERGKGKREANFNFNQRLGKLRYAHTPNNIRKNDPSRVKKYLVIGTTLI